MFHEVRAGSLSIPGLGVVSSSANSPALPALLIRGEGTVFLLPVLYYTFVKVLVLCNTRCISMHFYNTEAVPSGDCHFLCGDVSESGGVLLRIER